MNRTFKTVFLVSLIANVLLLGVVLGALPRRFEGRPSFRDRFKTDIEKLPEPARTRLRENMTQAGKSDEPGVAEIRRAREGALRVVAAEPFDEAAYDRQVDKISELRRAMFKRMSDNFKEIVKGLPPDQRKAVAEVFKRPPPGPPA
ncbi:MAG TPA: periplasmic heavy metal sensor [Candidatus Binatia bacterium]